MPLHDWSELPGWEGVHLLWIAELLRHVKRELPTGFRAYLGTGPALAIGAPPARPDLAVRSHVDVTVTASSPGPSHDLEPDTEVAVAALDAAPSLYVERDRKLIAAVEIVSPRNKDRPVARTTYQGRYLAYLMEGVHLLLVDVHRRPAGFSFADAIAQDLTIENQPSLPAPLAASYRVGEPAATGGHLLAIWRRPLTVGQPLPTLPLSLGVGASVPVDLEQTYQNAAADAYLA